MAAPRNVVVTVYGEGGPAAEDRLRALAATLPGPPGSYRRADLVLGTDLHPRLLSSSAALPDLVAVGGGQVRRAAAAWARALPRLLGLIMGLPRVRLDAGGAVFAGHTHQAYRDVVETTLLWSVWPVLLTLVQTVVLPVARTNGLLLEVLLLGLLALLARSQWRPGYRVTAAGYVWLGLCLALAVGLWIAPQWTALATRLSSRVYGLAQLVAATVLLAMAAEVATAIARGRVSRRCGLAGLCLAVLPLLLLSLLAACVWALALNALLAVGSPPALEAFKGWQQTFTQALGYHLASAEWAAAWITTAVAVLAACGHGHGVLTGRGESTRRWLSAILVALPAGVVFLALYMLLTSPYLGAPLGKLAQRWGAGADVTTIYTWSAFRLLPWLVLVATPVGLWLAALSEAGFYLMPPDGSGLSSRRVDGQRLGHVLRFLDRGDYDRVHVIAYRQGSLVALEALQNAELSLPLALTTVACPASTLYGDLLDRPGASPGSADWRNLFRQEDVLGGPVGNAAVDLPLSADDGGEPGVDAALTARVLQVMQAPLPVPPGISTAR